MTTDGQSDKRNAIENDWISEQSFECLKRIGSVSVSKTARVKEIAKDP